MAQQVELGIRNRNPDVLTSIANLSNDEVFTPPEFANRMLDTLAEAWAASNDGANIWADPNVTFLDPFTKSGVFLREITKRLVDGLEPHIPDLQERVDHVLGTQVFGIAITELTALLARRSVYCSKWANGKHSIATCFENEHGNIWFERGEHSRAGKKCRFCGASREQLERGDAAETYAYPFIHTDDAAALLANHFGADVKFDVIIGNPPYQLNDGGGSGTSAAPIYQHFVTQAQSLEARYISMVIPSRWFSGGKGLDDFRDSALNDAQWRSISDFPDASDVFPGVQIKGGVCFFLWEKGSSGPLSVRTFDKGELISQAVRPFKEPGADVFVRYNEGIEILKKVVTAIGGSIPIPQAQRFSELVSVRRPFGLSSTFRGRRDARPGDLELFETGQRSFVARGELTAGAGLVDAWKVFIPFLASGSDSFPHPILGKPFVGKPEEVCTETYLAIGPFSSESEASHVISYISTKIFRFLVLLRKPSQNATKKVYEFVPIVDFSREWDDQALKTMFSLSDSDVSFIDQLVRPMEVNIAE